MKRIALLCSMCLFLAGCTDATKAQFGALGSRHHVELWSCGTKIGEWNTTGKVNSVSNSDGFFFVDEKTGKNVEITGTIIITRL